jgi:hypothetical protein
MFWSSAWVCTKFLKSLQEKIMISVVHRNDKTPFVLCHGLDITIMLPDTAQNHQISSHEIFVLKEPLKRAMKINKPPLLLHFFSPTHPIIHSPSFEIGLDYFHESSAPSRLHFPDSILLKSSRKGLHVFLLPPKSYAA